MSKILLGYEHYHGINIYNQNMLLKAPNDGKYSLRNDKKRSIIGPRMPRAVVLKKFVTYCRSYCHLTDQAFQFIHRLAGRLTSLIERLCSDFFY